MHSLTTSLSAFVGLSLLPLLSGLLATLPSSVSAAYWYETIDHQGLAFGAPDGYVVYRNVKDYGAKGDGTTDDSDAINQAISDGARCGDGCNSTTTLPAVVYFPSGTYSVSKPVDSFYYTTLLGDPTDPPTLKATSDFVGIAVIDSDPNNRYIPQNNFFRSVRNFIIDVTAMPDEATATGIHWRVAQATSINFVTVNMSPNKNSSHQGIYSEDGSGGFISDFTTTGGKYGIFFGNQQMTITNLHVSGAGNGVAMPWNWQFTYRNTTIEDCDVGFNILTGGDISAQTVGGTYILDSTVSNVGTFVQTSTDQPNSLAGQILIDNAVFNDVTNAVADESGQVAFQGPGSGTVGLWGQGNVYSGTGTSPKYTRDSLADYKKPSGLVNSNGFVFGQSRPEYASTAASDIVSVKSNGVKGDGTTDDTDAINKVIAGNVGKVVYFDVGTYLITDTITIPEGSIIYGEFFPVLLASGDAFADASNPKIFIQVGKSGDSGSVAITGLMFSSVGGSSGAIMMEWNINGNPGAVGLWDSHFRLGGAKGTNLDVAHCLKQQTHDGNSCDAASLALHVTAGAGGYFENMWVWAADHDLDDPAQQQLDVFSARGILIESTDPVWFHGTASEHHTIYEYNLNKAKNVYMGFIQTESPYYQPNPAPPAPFTASSDFADPDFPSDVKSAWALYIQNSQDVIVGGAGLYSFFSDYTQDCEKTFDCQTQVANVDSASTGIRIYSLATVDVSGMFSVDGKAIAQASDNHNGFQDNILIWTADSATSKTRKTMTKRVTKTPQM